MGQDVSRINLMEGPLLLKPGCSFPVQRRSFPWPLGAQKQGKTVAPYLCAGLHSFPDSPCRRTAGWFMRPANESLLEWPQTSPWMLTWAPMYFLFRRCFRTLACLCSASCFPASSASKPSSVFPFLAALFFGAMLEPGGCVVWMWAYVHHACQVWLSHVV